MMVSRDVLRVSRWRDKQEEMERKKQMETEGERRTERKTSA
jgi:hypothetical protein